RGGRELPGHRGEGGALLKLRDQLGRALGGGVHAADAGGVEEDLADFVLRLGGRRDQPLLRGLYLILADPQAMAVATADEALPAALRTNLIDQGGFADPLGLQRGDQS